MPEYRMAGGCSPNSCPERLLHPATFRRHFECRLEWCDSWSTSALRRCPRKPATTARGRLRQLAFRTDSSRARIPAPEDAPELYPRSMRRQAVELRRIVRREPGPEFYRRRKSKLYRCDSGTGSFPLWPLSAWFLRLRHPMLCEALSIRRPQLRPSPEWPHACPAVSLCQP